MFIITRASSHLRELREQAHLSVRYVSKFTGISVPTIYSVEDGKHDIKITTYTKLVAFYKKVKGENSNETR